MSNEFGNDDLNDLMMDGEAGEVSEPTEPTEPTVEKEEPEAVENELPPLKPYPHAGKVNFDSSNWMVPVAKGTFNADKALGATLPQRHQQHVLTQLKDDDVSADRESAQWGMAVESSIGNCTHDDYVEERLFDETSEWTNELTYEGKNIRATSPSNIKRKGGRTQGTAGIMQVRSILGLSTILYIPLPHTSMYIAISIPSLGEMLDLEYALLASKIDLGRYTLGASFSADEAERVRIIMRLILSHTYTTSAGNLSVDDLLNLIKVTDYPIILKDVAAALYPNGFELYQPCLNDPRSCVHVERGIVDLRKCTFYDLTRFSKRRLANLSSPRGTVTVEEINAISEAEDNTESKTYTMKSGATFHFRTPTLSQMEESSQSWFNDLIATVDESLELSTRERNDFLYARSRLQEICKYHHWVEKISWAADIDDLESSPDENTAYMAASEDIFEVLQGIASEEELKEELLTAIKRYINDSVIAMVGLPDYECTVCGEHQEKLDDDNLQVRGVIPVNTVNLFTTLVTQKLAQRGEKA